MVQTLKSHPTLELGLFGVSNMSHSQQHRIQSLLLEGATFSQHPTEGDVVDRLCRHVFIDQFGQR